MTLYDPAHFTPLTEEPWDEARVRDGIAAIVADADAAYSPDELWPAHEWDGWDAPLPLKGLYVGAAGVLWALDRLRPYAEPALDLRAAAERVAELWAEPDLPRSVAMPPHGERALFAGETGVLLRTISRARPRMHWRRAAAPTGSGPSGSTATASRASARRMGSPATSACCSRSSTSGTTR